ncbi:AMP-binding protein [Solihabitans fulvus]|uniref:AMP-binding protein n=1 Tax=Solihabitans fulvus TaxID=1892852 RepID=A0A5B2XSG8_9PSEU|nr:AMP-binding protein [Solihabitans fulvus]KAA2265799.1 AMP-binding protein [Solihabitans fulvus]
MFEYLLDLVDGPVAATAFHLGAEPADRVDRGEFAADIVRLAVDLPTPGGPGDGAAWVAVRDRYLFAVATIAALRGRSAALVERDGPLATFDALAAACPPALVLCDDPDSGASRWAVARGVRVHVLTGARDGDRPVGRLSGSAVAGTVLHFFSSGTTGPVKCVGVNRAHLSAAISGVIGRLSLTAEDISLSIAPLTHTLGFVTGVLAALGAGGAVAFADPGRARQLREIVTDVGPSWCAASPSGHALVHTLVHDGGLRWRALRFLRASAGPLPDELVDDVERHFGVPLINAYAMTEAPGEIASQDLVGVRRLGTVGRPSLCEVDVRGAGGSAPAAGGGEVWIRGPNVATAARAGDWVRTGDVGLLDDAGFLRLTGRIHDVINQGGLKVWPPEVEAAARLHPSVRAAVAFPIPHKGLGETVGLAVVPRAGEVVERSSVRRLLMAELPREKWPSTIVICDRVPLNGRGKIDRRGLSSALRLDPLT